MASGALAVFSARRIDPPWSGNLSSYLLLPYGVEVPLSLALNTTFVTKL